MISCSSPFALQLDKGFKSVGQENAFSKVLALNPVGRGARGVIASVPIRNTGSEVYGEFL